MRKVKNMGRKTMNFLEDKEIVNSVKKYPCLYDNRETNFIKTSETRKMLGTKLNRKSEWRNEDQIKLLVTIHFVQK